MSFGTVLETVSTGQRIDIVIHINSQAHHYHGRPKKIVRRVSWAWGILSDLSVVLSARFHHSPQIATFIADRLLPTALAYTSRIALRPYGLVSLFDQGVSALTQFTERQRYPKPFLIKKSEKKAVRSFLLPLIICRRKKEFEMILWGRYLITIIVNDHDASAMV